MVLRAKYIAVALNLQEAAGDMSSNEMRGKLQDAIGVAHNGSGKAATYVDHIGDGESGDCVYDCDGDMMKAPYSKGTDSSDDNYSLDTSKAGKVAMRTSYEDMGDDADGYASMAEAKLYTKGGLPVCERFVSKKERDAASSGDFAGKGKSFPILKAADVAAAAASIGRAGSDNHSVGTIKANIIKIAKAKGWTSELPKAWQDGGDDAKEAARSTATGLRLVESAATVETIVLRESKSDYEIKLIAPGKGSSAFYPAEVLKRDGPKVFGPGTHVYVNHPTQAEEAARPEGDVKNLAGVLTTAAAYYESHAKGPGLYARMKVFADHGQMVEEKAPHVGMSIRASGIAEASRKQDGLPVLKELTSAESVDVVTKAGAGGMILTEAARSANPQQEAGDMTAEEAKRLIEAAVKPFQTRFLRDEARAEATKLLESVALPQPAKLKIIERAVASVPETADGALDLTKFRESVVTEAKSEGEYLSSITGGGRVFGMGVAGAVTVKPEDIVAREAAKKREEEEAISIFESIGMPKSAAQHAAKGRAA